VQISLTCSGLILITFTISKWKSMSRRKWFTLDFSQLFPSKNHHYGGNVVCACAVAIPGNILRKEIRCRAVWGQGPSLMGLRSYALHVRKSLCIWTISLNISLLNFTCRFLLQSLWKMWQVAELCTFSKPWNVCLFLITYARFYVNFKGANKLSCEVLFMREFPVWRTL
jgi:hypothetical protein